MTYVLVDSHTAQRTRVIVVVCLALALAAAVRRV